MNAGATIYRLRDTAWKGAALFTLRPDRVWGPGMIPVSHVGTDGRVYSGTDETFGHFELDEETIARNYAPIDSIGTGEIVTETTERGSTYFQTRGTRSTHRLTPNGECLCGAKASHNGAKPERWDPWNKFTRPPEQTRTVLIPSARPVSCKRCLKAERSAPDAD